MLSDNNKRTKPYLNECQLKELDSHLSINSYSDSKGIVDWIKNKYNISYSSSGVNSLLKRMGFVYKKPVLTPCEVDVSKQNNFIEEYQKLKNNLSLNDNIYFVDGVHPQHNC